MLEKINNLIDKAKEGSLKPKYMCLSYNTSKLIPYETNIKGENIYKNLILEIWANCSDNMIYFHNYKPKVK